MQLRTGATVRPGTKLASCCNYSVCGSSFQCSMSLTFLAAHNAAWLRQRLAGDCIDACQETVREQLTRLIRTDCLSVKDSRDHLLE